MGEPLTEEEQFALRSELRKLMRISRISSPGELYDASVSAHTFETINGTIINPISFDEAVDANLAKECGNSTRPHIPGCGEYSRVFPKNVNRVNILMKIRRSANRKLILRYVIYFVCKKRSVD